MKSGMTVVGWTVALVFVFQAVAPGLAQVQPSASTSSSFNRGSVSYTSLSSQRFTTTSSSSTPTPTAKQGIATSITTATTLASSLATSNQTAPASHSNATRVDATFGVLGTMLILSGVPMSAWGVRNKWSSVFIVGFYVGAFVVGMVALHFGVDGVPNPPRSITRGLFLLASLVGGSLVGGFCVVWWRGAQLLCAAAGGFFVGLFLLAVKSDGLIGPIGLRYILLAGLAALGFVLSTFNVLTSAVVLVGISALGASATVLGIDCFTNSRLKEFYVYNLGFSGLFPSHPTTFPLTLGIEIELGALAAIFLCSVAWQYRTHRTLKRASKPAQDDDETEAGDASPKLASLANWEEKYGNSPLSASRRTSTTAIPSPVDPPHQDRKRTQSATSTVDCLPKISISDFGEGRQNATSSPQSTEWDEYLSKRQVLVGPAPRPATKPLSHRSMTLPLSTFGISAALDTIDSEDGHGAPGDKADDDDDKPLGKIFPPSASARFPSVASLRARPTSLALPGMSTPARPRITQDARRNTMIDMRDENAFKGTGHGEPRIVVGDCAKAKAAIGPPTPPLARPVRARVMSCDELGEKHRRRLSQFQAPATENVVVSAELQAVTAKYDEQRRRDRVNSERTLNSVVNKRRSRHLGSIGNLSSFRSITDPLQHGTFGKANQRRQSTGDLVNTPVDAYDRKRDLRKLVDVETAMSTLRVPAKAVATLTPKSSVAKKHDWLGY